MREDAGDVKAYAAMQHDPWKCPDKIGLAASLEVHARVLDGPQCVFHIYFEQILLILAQFFELQWQIFCLKIPWLLPICRYFVYYYVGVV